MKLENIKIPDGYTVVGFDYPLEGDYVLTVHGDAIKLTPEDLAFNYPAIILLETAWKPEIGKYYEFSECYTDYSDREIRKYIGNPRGNKKYIYEDDTGETWRYMRPVQGELGK